MPWEKLTPEEMVKLLGDERPAVYKRAMAELAKRGPEAVPAMKASSASPTEKHRRNLVWTLTRIDSPLARQAVRTYLNDSAASVRHAAIQSVGLWRDGGASQRLVPVLRFSLSGSRRRAGEHR